MPIPMSRAWLEAECLRVTRKQLGCNGTQAVTIRRLHPKGSGPNWEPQKFRPSLDKVAEHYARKALAPPYFEMEFGSRSPVCLGVIRVTYRPIRHKRGHYLLPQIYGSGTHRLCL